MNQCFNDFNHLFNDKNIKKKDFLLTKSIKNFNFIYLYDISSKSFDDIYIRSDEIDLKIMTIDLYKNEIENYCEEYFIVCFDGIIIIIKISDYSIIRLFMEKFSDYKKYFVSENIQCLFQQIYADMPISTQNQQVFFEEIQNLIKDYKNCNISKQKIWKIVLKCISGFLIQKNYLKSNCNRIHFTQNDIKKNNVNNSKKNNKYKTLRLLGNGSASSTHLLYDFEEDKLLVQKKMFIDEQEKYKLIEREITNYNKLFHPLLPRYYGYVEENGQKDLLIEYINGQTLQKTDISEFSEEEIIYIIFELMISINYFHLNGLIYRDLKPNNVMIDQNHNAIIIDFDRLVRYFPNNGYENSTQDFSHDYIAPEITRGEPFTFKVDIFSLGKLIDKIFLKSKNKLSSKMMEKLQIMCNQCMQNDAKNRPTISQLIRFLYLNILTQIKNKDNTINDLLKLLEYNYSNTKIKDPVGFCTLGMIYGDDLLVTKNIEKAIYFYSLASDQNDLISQINLGLIFFEENHMDVQKAIHYLKQAAKQDDEYAEVLLGIIFFYFSNREGNYDNESLYYFSKAANKQMPAAQFFYCFQQTMNNVNDKQIVDFLISASEKKNSKIIENHDFFDSHGKYVLPNNCLKIITNIFSGNYFQVLALFSLGMLFYTGKFVRKNVNKSIKYFHAVAENDKTVNSDDTKEMKFLILFFTETINNAQNMLGEIYLDGYYVAQDIKQSIYYFTKSAEGNNIRAIFHLGYIYSSDEFGVKNIKKAIQYYLEAEKQLRNDYSYALKQISNNIYISNRFKELYYILIGTNAEISHIAANNLGMIYFEGKYIERDVQKSIYYLNLSANQNNSQAQYNLGTIYINGKYVLRNIDVGIKYLKLSAAQKNTLAQMNLGIILFEGKLVPQNIKEAISNLSEAAKDALPDSRFYIGYIHYQGNYVIRNMKKAIDYFKSASCLNNQYSKNNLGVIYKNGDGVKANISRAIEYFTEAIHQKNDEASRFNLAHIFFFGEGNQINIDESIKILLSPTTHQIPFYIELLALIICQKDIEIKFKTIENEFKKYNCKSSQSIALKVYNLIKSNDLFDPIKLLNFHEKMKSIQLIYVNPYGSIITLEEFKKKSDKYHEVHFNKNAIEINDQFYMGLGII